MDTAERLQGAMPGSVCQSPSPPPTAPGLFLPGSQGTSVKGDHGRNSTGFTVAPSGQLPHGAHNTVPREDEKPAQRGGEGNCQGHTSRQGRDLKPSQAALGSVPSR